MKTKTSSPFKKSLDASWKEGIAANIMLVIMDYYLVPFALFLGASVQEIGLLVAFPHFLGSLSQLLSTSMIRWVGSRLRFLIFGSMLQACLLIPMGLLTVAFDHKIVLLIIFATFFRILGNLIGTAWGSLMSEYLAPNQRGEYLGWRSQVVGIAGILAMLLAGATLYFLKHSSSTYLGYLLLFCFVGICRFISAYYFTHMQDMPYHEDPQSTFSFLQFLKQFQKSNFVKYMVYVASITFATQLAAPYFSVYMIKNLNFSYMQYTWVHLVSVVSGLLSFRLWGQHADHVGNARVLKTTGFLLPLVPLLWLIGRHPFYLIFIEALAGFLWSGFNLAAANFIFDAVIAQKRIRCLSYCNLIYGIAIFSGASLGGYLSTRLPNFFGDSMLTLFALSGVLRLLFNILLIRNFKEVRSEIQKASSPDLFFSVLGVRPLIGRNRERQAFSFLKKPDY